MSQDLAEQHSAVATEHQPSPRRGLGGRVDRLAEGINSLTGHLPSPIRRVIPRATRWRLIGLALVVLLVLVWSSVAVSSTSTYSATVLVLDPKGPQVIGIPPPGEVLDFGDLSPGLELSRELVLTNEGSFHSYIMIITWGGIRDFLSVDDAFFSLGPGDERAVVFTLQVPKNAEAKRYSGRVVVVRLPWWRP